MRRKEKTITDRNEILEILSMEKICRIAFTDGKTPYIIPVNYGYKDNTLYIHCAKAGRKIELIKKNSTVCFEIEHDVHIIQADTACRWDTLYTSIIGYGNAELVTDTSSVINALDVIMKQQSGQDGWSYDESSLKNVMIIKITVESLSGKRST